MDSIKISTFNVRTFFTADCDGINSFVHRSGRILDKIEKEKPDVICFQEVSELIRKFLDTYLLGYVIVGHGRLENYDGEAVCTAYRKDTIELFTLEHFWLSETPDVPGSRYEIQSPYPRTCVMTTVRKKGMKSPVSIYNLHLDNESDQARILGMEQVMNKIADDYKIKPFPVLMMGDFNAYPDSDTIKFCKDFEKFKMIDISENSGITFHNFGGNGIDKKAVGNKIDYIFADEKTAGKKYTLTKWDECEHGIYLSDHYPLCCEIEL